MCFQILLWLKRIAPKLFLTGILLYPSIFSASNEDFIYHTDDMFESADYLVALNKNISKHMGDLDRMLIPCLQSFSKYVDYLADKIEVGSDKELQIVRTFGNVAVEGPAFMSNFFDLDTVLEEYHWNINVAQELRDALNEARAMWTKLTVVLSEHILERTKNQQLRKTGIGCNESDDCNVCGTPGIC